MTQVYPVDTLCTSFMRILGIDPGLHLTGYGCLDIDGPQALPVVVEAGVFRIPRRAPMPDRLHRLYEDLCSVIEETRPDRIVIEQVFSHPRFARTAILMGHARGVVVLAGARFAVPQDELAPAEIKQAVTGHGRATKRQVQESIAAQCGLTSIPEPADVADALAIALCGGRRYEAQQAIGVS